MKHHHQKAWLAAHPHRSQKWLSARLAEGFEVHHIDGDHSNDDLDNLVLIEGRDHMLLHYGHRSERLRKPSPKVLQARSEAKLIGERACGLRGLGLRWYDVAKTVFSSDDARILGPYRSPSAVTNMARQYALDAGLEWPIKLPPDLGGSHIGHRRAFNKSR